MNRHLTHHLFSIVIIVILVFPIATMVRQGNNNSTMLTEPTGIGEVAGTNTWHDDCNSTSGWISQAPSSGFDPKHTILESGTLSSTGGYLIVTGIADPVTERKGPLYIKQLGDAVTIDSISMFQAEVDFTYVSNVYGFLSVYLFDESKQKAVMLRLHDAWAASESHPESVFFTPGEEGDGTVHDEILFGSWSGYLRFWYDESTGSLVGELDDGTPNQATLETSGNFNPDRAIKYIGIQWSRHPGADYGGDTYRLLDIQLTYDVSESTDNWLTGWNNRKSHQILGTPGAGTDYQVKIIVKYGSGTDIGNTVYTDYECQLDFDDIRFTDNDGETLLDYWLESYFDSDNATIWVEIKDNLDLDVSIYMYYGNPNCTTASDGTETFVFFDDFDDSSIDTSKWETYGPWTESGGVAAFSITGTGGMSILPSLRTDNAWDMRNKSIVSSWRFNEKSVNREWGVSCANTIGDDHTKLSYFIANDNGTHNIYVLYYDVNTAPGYDVFVNPGPIWYEGVFHKTEFDSTPNGNLKNQWLLNEELVYSYNDYTFDASLQYIFLGFYVYGYSNTLESGNLEMEFNYVFLRNQVGIDVTHDSWSETESFLEGWNYRISHVINGAAGAGTNYQIEINVHFGYGTSSGKDAYCNEKCQPDFDDIRFTDYDGITLLDYWTESVIDSDVSIFWVEVVDDLSVEATIYMYYGNSTVSTLSNGTATFIFFDDFESISLGSDPDPNKWWLESTQDSDDYVRIASDPEGGSNQVAEASETGDSVANVAWAIDWGSVGNIAIGHKFRYDLDYKGYYTTKDSSDTFIFIEELEYLGENNHRWYEADVDYYDYIPSLVTNTDEWYSWEYRFFNDEMTLLDRDSNILSTGGYCFPTINETRTTCTRYGLRFGANTWWTDDMYVRKFVSSEPMHGEWGDSTISWHHNCSNTTGFVYNDTWNMNWMPWTIQSGSLTSDGTYLSVTSVVTGTGWHGPVFEYELPQTLRVQDINNFSAIFDVDNSLNAYVGYEVLMLGDSDRNPVIFFSFHDGWAESCQGSYGAAYVFTDGSYVGFGSGYPVGWTSFNGIINVSYTEAGLLAYVEGHGEGILPGLTEVDFNREIKYIAIASARYGSDPLIPVKIDEIYLNYQVSSSEPPLEASINDVEDFWYETSESGNVIEWTVGNFNPTSYELWRDGGLLTSEAWPGGSTIEIDIDNLSPGEYNYTIVVYGDDTIVSDTVIVTVMDLTVPSLGRPADAVYEYGTTGHTIVWSVSDLYPGEYVVTRDSTLIESDSWTSGVIVIDTDGLAIGVYTYMIAVTDTSVNLAFDMVTITVVDTTAPILNHPSDIIGNIASASIQVTWQPTDLLPFNYAIYENGTQVDSGTWTSGENLTYTLEDLTTSWYNITIVVWDTSGNYARDMVIVNIQEESIQPIGDILVVSISIGSIGVIVVIVGLICRNKGGVQSAPQDTGYSW